MQKMDFGGSIKAEPCEMDQNSPPFPPLAAVATASDQQCPIALPTRNILWNSTPIPTASTHPVDRGNHFYGFSPDLILPPIANHHAQNMSHPQPSFNFPSHSALDPRLVPLPTTPDADLLHPPTVASAIGHTPADKVAGSRRKVPSDPKGKGKRKVEVLDSDSSGSDGESEPSKLKNTHGGRQTGAGFFSVQVLENALKVWGLNLTRWRGQEMRRYQDHPHTQLAFILNLQQHWFTLRRFGVALPNIDDDPGDGHWFNLNSSLSSPEWVGKLYLGMVLQQAEADGYSVFAVTQIDPSTQLALPRTEADEVASTLPEPRGASLSGMQAFNSSSSVQSPSAPNPSTEATNFEDDDYELQAALQASLMGSRTTSEVPNSESANPLAPPRLTRTFAALPPSDPHTPSSSNSGVQTPTDGTSVLPQEPNDPDPVAASMERNRLMLQQMRAQQEYAQRELLAETPDAAAMDARRRDRQQEEEEEAELLRRAIEESEAMARAEGHAYNTDNEDMDIETGDPQTARFDGFQTMGHTVTDRVYDDDDAELQAALRASLEHVPEGWDLPQLPPHQMLAPTSAILSAPDLEMRNQNTDQEQERDKDDAESVLSDETSTSVTDNTVSDASVEPVSVDELRKKRLARFGA